MHLTASARWDVESVHCGTVNRPCKWRNCITSADDDEEQFASTCSDKICTFVTTRLDVFSPQATRGGISKW
ncbi:hypothetical protein PUN28_017256 [Cardiocondyla obscurior]|uniref:Uncharacterized protein n=1 Tax=Cardiocondyla obscurior TaxID=286306 RepID=A0AAW2ENC0_9HYME